MQFVGTNGKVISHGGAPGLGFSVNSGGDQRFNPLKLVAGAWPTTAPTGRDGRQHRRRRALQGRRSRRRDHHGAAASSPSRSRAIADYGNSTSLGGATIAIFDLPTAQQLFHKQGQLDEIDVASKAGRLERGAARADPEPCCRPTRRCAPRPQQTQASVNDFGSVLTVHPLHPARLRRHRPLRRRLRDRATRSRSPSPSARASSRRCGRWARPRARCAASVVLEGLVTGLFASTVGLFVGLGLAKGLEALFKAVGRRPCR